MAPISAFEPELQNPPPRRIVERPGSSGRPQGRGLLFLRIFLIPFIAVGIFTLYSAIALTRVAMYGVPVTAVITNLVNTSTSDGDTYSADFQFRYHGTLYSAGCQVSSKDYQSMSIGQQVQTVILPSAPTDHPILSIAESGQELGAWLFASLWNLVVLVFLWVAFVWPEITRRVYLWGVPAVATITDRSTGLSDNSTTYHVKYVFEATDAYGRSIGTFAGKSTIGQKDWESLAVGQSCTVLYLPGKPRWSELYQFGPYRVIE